MNSKQLWASIFTKWLPLAFTLTVLCFLVLVVEQQNLRMGANEPQVAISGDLTALLSNGQSTDQYFTQNKVDIATSLSTYIIVYDASKNPVVYSGVLNDKAPDIPTGTLEATKTSTDVRVTWQPQPDVRQAIVAKHFVDKNGKDGFVVVGRSLREIEDRIGNMELFVLAAWIGGLIGTLALMIGTELLQQRTRKLKSE